MLKIKSLKTVFNMNLLESPLIKYMESFFKKILAST